MINKRSPGKVTAGQTMASVRHSTCIAGVLLLMLCISGAVLVFWNPPDLQRQLRDPRFRFEILLSGLLVANSFVLHCQALPLLAQGGPLQRWAPSDCNVAALLMGLANSIWPLSAAIVLVWPGMFDATTAVAILALGALLWLTVAAGIRVVLVQASRQTAPGDPTWSSTIGFDIDEPETSFFGRSPQYQDRWEATSAHIRRRSPMPPSKPPAK